MNRPLVWDLFCTVIDNHGDLGVCWRLACDLASRGQQVRLWVDDASALAWMARGGHAGVQCLAWAQAACMPQAPEPATDVLVEAFGCHIPDAFVAATARAWAGRGQPVWINLEYLSAEPYVKRCHGLPSPLLVGPAKGWTKHFFYPGFTEGTGGLLRETDLTLRQQNFDRVRWLAGHGLSPAHTGLRVSLFCYEPAALPDLLSHWAACGHHGLPVTLLVTAGRAQAAVCAWQARGQAPGLLKTVFLPYLSQRDFDHLLWACDLNLVRGEDSLVRALWAGQPLVWQLYPQDDGAHLPKLQAFLDVTQAPPASRRWHQAWNAGAGIASPQVWAKPTDQDWQDWQAQARMVRQRLLAQTDLSTQLLHCAGARFTGK